jgi:mannose-6-phosphate isomerase-like protein (cupin superfamily)
MDPAPVRSAPQPDATTSAGAAAQRCDRPWGWFETLAEGEGYRVKRLVLHAQQRLSLQRHHHRCEHWLVACGDGLLELDGALQTLAAGSSATIPLGAVHRASAGERGLVIIELQRGGLLSEDDIERLADDYGRGNTPGAVAVATPKPPPFTSN